MCASWCNLELWLCKVCSPGKFETCFSYDKDIRITETEYIQYLDVLQDSKHNLSNLTVKVQSSSQVTDIHLTERHSLEDDHLSTSLGFFNLPLGIGPNDTGLPF